MALPVVDPGWAAAAAARPCTVRRQLIEAGALTADLATLGFFPKDGQYVDTPAGVSPRWTTDTPS